MGHTQTVKGRLEGYAVRDVREDYNVSGGNIRLRTVLRR